MDVNPICEDRFERLDDQQAEVGRTLQEHGRVLSEHGQTLEHHSRQLARLEEELGQQGDLLSQNQSTLAVMATKIGSVEAELLRLNGWQMKLIFLLVIRPRPSRRLEALMEDLREKLHQTKLDLTGNEGFYLLGYTRAGRWLSEAPIPVWNSYEWASGVARTWNLDLRSGLRLRSGRSSRRRLAGLEN